MCLQYRVKFFRYGYDSDDPFIDNSDVHDEIVPETLAPAHGGFYVNCGKLEFKARDSAEENSDLEAVIQVRFGFEPKRTVSFY